MRTRIPTLGLIVVCLLLLPLRSVSGASSAKQNFEWYCAQCHGLGGGGDGINSVPELPVGPMNLTNPEEIKKFSDEQIIKTVTHGGPTNTLDSLMPPWGNTLTAAEIKALMRYVRTLCRGADCPK